MYQVIYADPPWRYLGDFAKPGYPTMSTADICGIDVAGICDDDALLFLWVASSLLDDSLSVVKAWGFVFSTVGFVWQKGVRTLPGNYTLPSTELCLIAKRGSKIKRASNNERQFVQTWDQARHSQKPYQVREAIERMYPTQKKIELFAREQHPGWDCWGNEV